MPGYDFILSGKFFFRSYDDWLQYLAVLRKDFAKPFHIVVFCDFKRMSVSAVVEGMPHIRVFFCFQSNAGILKAVKIRMDIKVGIDLECTILSDDQLVESDDGKSTPQTVNDIVNDLIWRIEFVVWADDLCQCVNREILFVIQNEICQEQVALVRLIYCLP